MAISNFLNPAEENGDGEENEDNLGEEEILQEVIEEHLGFQSTQNDDDDEEQLMQPTYSTRDAKHALQILVRFTES